MFREAKRLKTQSTITSCFRKISVAENAGQNMLSHLRENEKCDGLNSKETQADHMPTSSLSANNLDSELKIIEDTLTSDHHEYSKNEINEGPHQPLDFKYPINNGRKFQKNWFDQFPWLEYYEEVNIAFCFPCRMFKNEVLGCSEKAYTEIGFQNWKKGIEKFKSHESSEAHKSSTERLRAYESSLRKGSVTVQLISQRASEMEENKKYLESICETLLFCARQGIALRGHDEKEDSSNRGTFLELLNLRSKDNALIKKFFIEKEKYFSYSSKEIQNEILELMSKQVCEAIASEASHSDCYSILVDETADIAHDEQVAIVIRYVRPEDFSVHERFLGFFRNTQY
ncbi:Zinc finger MYM-type protein 1 [Araneus ventricosus]|uniref:Zinc finger MYM-type protein 1 n=1 Tax=Araneus ventricosus TaxID=182803 RepID=A0A4Y2N590_ARAVE|nr:Zinc finger MYM-type protein 1 [Araneus ventricosus]